MPFHSLLAAAALASSPAAAQKPAAPRGPCALLSEAEVGAAQHAKVTQTQPTQRTEGALTFADCLYTATPFGRSLSLEVARETRPGAVREAWKAIFRAPRPAPAEKEEEEHKAAPRSQRGLGSEAFWVAEPPTGALYVRKGAVWFRLSSGGARGEKGALARLRLLARKVLQRL